MSDLPGRQDVLEVVGKLYWERERLLLSSSLSVLGSYVSPRGIFMGGKNVWGVYRKSDVIALVDVFPNLVRLSRLPVSEEASCEVSGFSKTLYITPISDRFLGVSRSGGLELEGDVVRDLGRLGIYIVGSRAYLPFGHFPYEFVDDGSGHSAFLLEMRSVSGRPTFIPLVLFSSHGEGRVVHSLYRP